MNVSTQGQTEDHHHNRNPPIRLFHRPPFILAIILLGYLTAATLFALLTPPWQLPDEPAHYNYIAHIARGDGLPVLKMGDFDAEYISKIVSERFPPDLSVEPLRYEFYQPPLYYLTAVPIYWLAGGANDLAEPASYGHALSGLRLYGVLLGFISLLLIYACLTVAFPHIPAVRLCATAFAATLPMHVAMTAAANNDSLAIVLLLASSLVLIRWMRAALFEGNFDTKGALLVLGMFLGFGLMTKIYAYIYLPICLATVGLISWRGVNIRQALINAGWILLPALLLGLSIWIRNMSLYGLLDPLGLTWHDAVVVGQATTPEWIAQNGWDAYWERAIGFTFRSFWGVFGWLGLFWDSRLYTAVQVLSIAIGAGFLLQAVSLLLSLYRRPNQGSPVLEQKALNFWMGFLLISTAGAVLVGYVFYNLKFVQHQGRYFFWGILPIGTFFALGWRQLMQPLSAFAVALLLGILAFYSLLFGDANPWTMLIYLFGAGWLLLHALLLLTGLLRDNQTVKQRQLAWLSWIPASIQNWLIESTSIPTGGVIKGTLWATPFLLMFALCIHTVFGYVVPQLGR